MIKALIENPILLLFVVIGIGYGFGNIKIRGANFGVAAVLFVGLIFGGLSPDFHIPESIIFLGLAMYIYSIGLSSGPSFFTNFRRHGFRDVYFSIFVIIFSTIVALGLFTVFGFEPATLAGLFSGSSTNTAALAGLLDTIKNSGLESNNVIDISKLAVIGYSLTYPMGIVGTVIAIIVIQKLLKIDFKKEEDILKKDYPIKEETINKTIEITSEKYINITIRDLKRINGWKVVFGRVRKNNDDFLSNFDTKFDIGDLVTIVGNKDEVMKVVNELGREAKESISSNHSEYIGKRIFVSNPDIAGERLSTLNLNEKFSAIITRIRRGDISLLADSNTVIELGDQVTFVARRKDIKGISEFFGDSYESLSKINLLSFGMGIAMGLLLGMINIEFPGGITIKLGFAGGPIIVALILGALRRTGPIVWTLPYSANLTLRQIGLTLLLTGIGINSGNTFFSTLSEGGGGMIILAGLVLSFSTTVFTLIFGYKFYKIPFSLLVGMVATQPAILDFALEKTKNKLPLIGYTIILPISLIIKILFVQIIYIMLS